ncbi:MAG TPA: PEGA domain-containing protein [Polyangiaceae bacterium]|nr:PEGA domain-containing protein [Polyangiaceae bacterium]
MTAPLARRALASALTLALAAPPAVALRAPTALAQPKPPPLKSQLTGAAREHFETGVRLAGRRDWNGARTSFQAAYDASANPRVLFNVAVSERELGRYPAAVEAFRRELAEGRGKLSKDEEAEVSAAIASLEKLLASLLVEVSEPGAEVFLDGEKVGVSPLKLPLVVSIGERRVRATKPGYADAVDSVRLASGASGKLALRLVPVVKTAVVNVSVAGPPNAVVTIDGKEVGPAPYTGRVLVSAEPHQFSAQAPGYVPATKSVVVTELPEGQALNVRLEPAAEQSMGKLVVLARPEGATIELDGKPVGASRWEGPVSARAHQVVVKKRGFYPFSYDVEVPRGGERSVTATLNEDRNTNFVPWLIGTVVVLGATAVAVGLIASKPDQEPVNGTLPPFAVGTQGFRF